jgi:hypothetical protein
MIAVKGEIIERVGKLNLEKGNPQQLSQRSTY